MAFSSKTNKPWVLTAPSRPVTPAVTSDLCVSGSDFERVSVLLEGARAEPLPPSPCSDTAVRQHYNQSFFNQFFSSSCFTGIKGQDADWILPCRFCVLFSVLLQIRVFFPPSCHFYVYPVQGIFRELAADTNEHVRDACEMWCFFGCLWFGFFCGFHIF